MTSPVRVVVADDHPVVREGLAALLSSLDGIDVVGEACDGREAVRQAVTLRPDVLVMDLQMPGLDGIGATRELRKAAPEVAVLALTMYDDDLNVAEALRAGARGYLVKGASQNQVVRAIFDVAAGSAVFGPEVAGRLLDRINDPAPVSALFPQLTPREREVLDLLAAGLPNSSIGARLGLSAKTVGNHVSAILTKLPARNRAEAMIAGRDAGLGREQA